MEPNENSEKDIQRQSLIMSDLPLTITPQTLISSFQSFKKNTIKNYNQIINEMIKLNITTTTGTAIESLKKDPIERTFEDVYNIKTFLNETKLVKKFKDESLPQESLNKMIIMCAVEMRYQSIDPSEILFRIGESGKDFYLILSGAIDLLKLDINNELMTGFQYFSLLMKLKRDNENYIYYKIIDSNQNTYPIEEKDKKNLNQIGFYILYNEMLKNRITLTVFQIADLCCVDLYSIDKLNDSFLMDTKGLIEALDLIKEHFALFDTKRLNKYDYLTLTYNPNKVITYSYQVFLQLNQGSYFGDSALDKQITRNSTVKSIEKTEFAVLDGVTYYHTIRKEKIQLTNREINFLYKNFFFKSIPMKVFEKKHFNMFISRNIKKGEEVCKEDQPITDLFFIRKGTIDLVTNKNIVETQFLLDTLDSKHKKIKRDNEFYASKNNLLDLKKELIEKKTRKVFIYGVNEVIGLDSFIFNYPYLVSAVVSSDNATVFKISQNNFIHICAEYNVHVEAEKVAIDKIKILYSRLFVMNKITIGVIDEKKAYMKQLPSSKSNKRNKIILPHDDGNDNDNEKKTFIRINPLLFFNNIPKYKDDNGNKSNDNINLALPKINVGPAQQLNSVSFSVSYEENIMRLIKQNIDDAKKKKMHENDLLILKLPKAKLYRKNMLRFDEFNSSENKGKIASLLLEQEKEKEIETRNRRNSAFMRKLDSRDYSLDIIKSNSVTIISSRKKGQDHLFYNKIIREKRHQFNIIDKLHNDFIRQNMSHVNKINVLRDAEYLNNNPFPKAKIIADKYKKKALEYQSYKKKIEKRLKESLRHIYN